VLIVMQNMATVRTGQDGVMAVFIVFRRDGGFSISYYARNGETGVVYYVSNSRVSAAYCGTNDGLSAGC
jgi:hypothetical protein